MMMKVVHTAKAKILADCSNWSRLHNTGRDDSKDKNVRVKQPAQRNETVAKKFWNSFEIVLYQFPLMSPFTTWQHKTELRKNKKLHLYSFCPLVCFLHRRPILCDLKSGAYKIGSASHLRGFAFESVYHRKKISKSLWTKLGSVMWFVQLIRSMFHPPSMLLTIVLGKIFNAKSSDTVNVCEIEFGCFQSDIINIRRKHFSLSIRPLQ